MPPRCWHANDRIGKARFYRCQHQSELPYVRRHTVKRLSYSGFEFERTDQCEPTGTTIEAESIVPPGLSLPEFAERLIRLPST